MSSSTKAEDYRVARAMQDIFRKAVQSCMEGNEELLREAIRQFVEGHPGSTPREVVIGFKSEGKTLLHVAASSGKLNVVNVLVELCGGQDVASVLNLQDDRGFTPLMNATVSESKDVMQRLVSLGANINLRTKDGASAVHYAAGDGNVERLSFLCERGADISFKSAAGTVLHWAAGKGHAEALAYLISRGASTQVNVTNNEGITAVFMAAVAGSDAGVKSLVDAGADVGMIVSGNLTLLHICAENGFAAAVESILHTETGRRCCSVATSGDGMGNLPIHMAAMSGHRELVAMLYDQSPAEGLGLPAEMPHSNKEENITWLLQDGERRLVAWQEYHQKEKERAEEAKKAAPSAVAQISAAAAESLALFDAIECPAADTVAAEQHKDAGNAVFKRGDFAAAVECYTAAIFADKFNASYWSNRSACYHALDKNHEALLDAETCRRLKPDWPKGCYRLATARLALMMYEDAAVAAFEGYKLDPSNKELKELIDRAVKMGQEEYRKQQREQS